MSETLNNNLLEDSRKRKHEESSDDEDSRKRPNLNSSSDSDSSDEDESDESDGSDGNAQVGGSEVGVVNESSNSQVGGSQEEVGGSQEEVGGSQGEVGGDSPSNLDPQSNEAAQSPIGTQSPIGAGADGVVVEGDNSDGDITGITRVETVSRTLEAYVYTQRTGTQEEQNTARFHLRNARDAAIEFISRREDRQTGSESPTTTEMRERLTEVDANIRKAGADAVIDEIAGNPEHFVQDYSIYDDTE
jgi:hypothetical protein